MESFSISVDCPGQEELLDELWPKLDDYCTYEVFEYASGKVLMIAFEKFLMRANSNLLAAITMDFTPAGMCQIDIVSGGGDEGGPDMRLGSEKTIVSAVIRIFVDICEAKGWKIEEYESRPDEQSG